MNGHKIRGLDKTRNSRTIKVTPTTRAIRAALAVSATMLALSGSGTALAGVCAITTLNTVECNGAFLGTIPGAEFVPTVDMTLILGSSAPTSVTPASGAIGIDATWGGIVTVITTGDVSISTDLADGIHQYGSTSATLDNQGGITSYGGGNYNAVDISAFGDVTVTNGGTLTAYAGLAYDVTTVLAVSYDGNVSVDNQASGVITAVAQDGSALGIGAYAYGATTVNNDGTISASSANGSAIGIVAYGYNGDATVTNAGSVEAYSLTGTSLGIEAFSYYGNANIDNAGTVAVGGDGTAIGALAYSVYGDANVTNSNSIEATSNLGSAYGAIAVSKYGYASVDNTATLTATAYGYAIGVASFGAYGSDVTNSGSISATSSYGNSYGVLAVSGYGTATVGNTGSIDSVGGYQAIGVTVQAYYDATLTNSGSISAEGNYYATGVDVTSDYGVATATNAVGSSITASAEYAATGIAVNGYYGSVVDNAGEVTASVYGGTVFPYSFSAIGVSALSYDGDSTVTNSGAISAYAYAYAGAGSVASTGVLVGTYNFDASVDNSGTIYAYAAGYGYYGGVDATGVRIYSTNGDVSVTNSGSIDSYAASSAGDPYYAYARGVSAYSYDGNVSIDNSGGITATGVYGVAVGVLGFSQNGDSSLVNSGSIAATSDFGTYGAYSGSYNGNASLSNSGDIIATATYGGATGAIANSHAGDATLDNSGSITATGAYGATGVSSHSTDGIVTVTNSATGSIAANAVYGDATGVDTYSKYGDINITNAGSISADSSYYSATGISAYSANGSVNIASSGDISATAVYGSALGVDAYAAKYGDVNVDNSGSIVASSVYNTAIGISAGTKYGYYSGPSVGLINVNNSGDITATSDYYLAAGIVAIGYNGTSVSNSGDITVSAYYGAYGVIAEDTFGDVAVDNSGTISVYAGAGFYYGATGYGVLSTNFYGNIGVTNSGSIAVDATSLYGPATAVGVSAENIFGDINVASSGSISVAALTGDYSAYSTASATGVSAVNLYLGAVTVDNSGTIDVSATTGYGSAFSNAVATGIAAETVFGDLTVYNSGDLTASAVTGDYSYDNQADAYGITTYSYDGNITVDNSGTVTATASSGANSGLSYANATGISALAAPGGYAGISIYNSGSVTATAEDNATGIIALSYGTAYFSNVYVGNSGDVTASAAGGYDADATGITAYAYNALVYQGGDVTASADGVDTANAVGVYVSATYSGFESGAGSSTDASASAYYTAVANGVAVVGAFASAYAAGDISATASADTGYGSAYATGLAVVGKYAYVETAGGSSISASADAYYAYASGLVAVGVYGLSLYNGGDIDVLATGSYGSATGMLGFTTGDISATNAGSITSEFDGAYGDTTGVLLSSLTGTATFTNDGDVTAIDADYAVGVQLDSALSTFLYNHGTITADSTAAGSIAVLTGNSTDQIWNYGTINGAIVTNGGDDYLYNAAGAVWNAVGYSNFGNGDDVIVNHGTIAMTDAVIDLGYHAVTGNGFYNFGTVSADGDNLISMGSGSGYATLVPSLNPNPFYNYGVIDFQDGAANDTLTIVGDFAGDGDVNVDVSGLNGASDLLYIDGSVVDGSVNTINVDLLDLSNSIATVVPMVYVTGNAVAGNFTLGTVSFDAANTFVTLDFDLIADIDATNATPDVWSLGIEVTGLSDTGTLAAAVAPGVQSLMNTQVGTWRQRMGVIDHFNKGAVSLWARIFTDKGSFTPDHFVTNFGQGGNFDWDQKNSGVEAGVDFAVTDELSLGLLLAKSKAELNLDSPGAGSADIDGDTYGIYGTWISPGGFYLDASYRWMSFDVDLNSVAGAMSAEGDAETFNLEMGYAWTLSGGLKVEPQLQYTKTSVDNIDVFSTTTGMTFRADGGDSSRGRLGLALRQSFGDADNGWMWTPYATLSAVREFDGENSFAINDTFVGSTNVEGTSALLELGFTAQTGNLAFYGGLNWQDGGAMNSFVGGQLGVRYTFGGAAPAPAPLAAPAAKTCADLDDDGDGVNNCNDKCLGSTAGQAVGPDGCPVPLTIDLKGVNFDFDMSTLRPDAVAILDEAIAILGKYPQLRVEVAGHTDSIGTEVYNQGLSERRAQTVYDYLSSHGIGTDRMVGPTGYGESRPIAPNTNEDGSDNPEGRARNRRTELNVQN